MRAATTPRTTPNADRLFRAFAQPTRLRILHLLRRGELCVCDLVDVLAEPQPTVSRHLAYLRRAGLVSVRAEGRWAYYRLAAAQGRVHRKLLDCLLVCADEVPEIAGDCARKAKLRRAGGCR
jgi:ArsR family transcriptional regulator, arsenate/arsenite/antimonite-responsive transcriptional repressor